MHRALSPATNADAARSKALSPHPPAPLPPPLPLVDCLDMVGDDVSMAMCHRALAGYGMFSKKSVAMNADKVRFLMLFARHILALF